MSTSKPTVFLRRLGILASSLCAWLTFFLNESLMASYAVRRLSVVALLCTCWYLQLFLCRHNVWRCCLGPRHIRLHQGPSARLSATTATAAACTKDEGLSTWRVQDSIYYRTNLRSGCAFVFGSLQQIPTIACPHCLLVARLSLC